MKSFCYSFFIFLIVSCIHNPLDKGPFPINVAKDISRAKELGIFMDEYNPQTVHINDTLNFEIIRAWTENYIKTDVVDENLQREKNWAEGKSWKLKRNFKPKSYGHLSFLVKGDFKKQFRAYGDNWDLYYCQLISSNDSAIRNNFTYFQTYGPLSYDRSTKEIELQFEYYTPSKDTTKYGSWHKFGKFKLTKK
jgi:hypothetical protein